MTRDLPAQGRLWIDPSSGIVLETEIRFETRLPVGPLQQASLSVEYRPARQLAMWVPAEMKERYEQIGEQLAVGPAIVATARYSNYRKFSVAVGTKMRLPPE